MGEDKGDDAPFGGEKEALVKKPAREAVDPEPYRQPAPAKGKPSEVLPQTVSERPPQPTLDGWNRMLTKLTTTPPSRKAQAEEAVSRILRTASGVWLVGRLFEVRKRLKLPEPRVQIHVMPKKLFPDKKIAEAEGYYAPEPPGEPLYHVYADWAQGTRSLGAFSIVIAGIPTSIRDDASALAIVIFHELLHVWFIHEYNGLYDGKVNTGHGAMGPRGYEYIHPDFEVRLRKFYREIAELEELDSQLGR